LLDDEGHSERELAKCLDMEESNLNRILNKLIKEGIIIQGEQRLSRSEPNKKGDQKRYKEIPYYINHEIHYFLNNILRFLTKDIEYSGRDFEELKSLKLWEIGTLADTNYLEAMTEKYHEYEILDCIMTETGSTEMEAMRKIYPELAEKENPGKYIRSKSSCPNFSKMLRGIKWKPVRIDQSNDSKSDQQDNSN